MANLAIRISTPDGDKEILPAAGYQKENLAAVLARHGYALNTRCGGLGLCRGCLVHLTEGAVAEEGRRVQAPATIRPCCSRPLDEGRLGIEIPARSLLAHTPLVVGEFQLRSPLSYRPLAEPSPGKKDLGLAFDIGTTTVVALLVDLNTGGMLARASAYNAQIRYGEDVLSRIRLCSASPAGLANLREAAVRETLAPLIREVCKSAQVDPARLAAATAAGNTTMLHLLAGEDPSPMGVIPFRPVFLERRILSAESIGLGGTGAGEDGACFPGDLEIHLLPGISAYVGADLTAGLHASGLLEYEGTAVLLDVGTNGEIILKHEGRLIACATAAGPAFEGRGLSCGMRAATGAVDEIVLEGQPPAARLRVIGKENASRPLGLCGSAYVDFLAEGRRAGLLNEFGRFEDKAYQSLPQESRRNGGGRAFFLRPGVPSFKSLAVTEADIASLLKAKAAVASGLLTLLRRQGLAPSEIGKLCLAGGFGRRVKLTNAIACGLLPGFHPGQVEVAGNTSLGGAYAALMDRSAWGRMESIRGMAEIVELNLDPAFEDLYIDQMTLP